jgi:hypothetical protein
MDMKKGIFTILIGLLFSVTSVFAQYITSEDNAGNYSQSDFVSEGNLGFGFGNWYASNNDGGYFRSAAGEQGANSAFIDISGNSFGLWANGFSDVGRLLTAQMPDGGTLVFTLAYQWDNGNRGFSLANGNWGTEVFNFNINDAGYTWSGGGSAATTPWTGQREFGVSFIFAFTQNGNDLDYSFLSLAGDGPFGVGTITGVNFDRLKFYVSGAGGGSGANMYFNSLKTEFEDPAYVPSTADVKINGNVTLESDQTLTVKDLTVPSGSSFTLQSLSTGTASLIINGTCTDEIKVERFLTKNDWHFLSSPVVNQPIVGPGNFIRFVEGIGEASVDFFRYDETHTGTTPWINIKDDDGTLNTNFGTPPSAPLFEEGLGYLVSYELMDVTKTFTGVPFTGPLLIPLTYTEAGSKGWNLVGNPYPSAIDWDEGNVTKTGLASNYYYIYNQSMNAGGGGYEYYKDFTSPKSTGANGDIPAMQAFFVEAAGGGGSITLSNNARKHSTQQFYKGALQNENLLSFKIEGAAYHSQSQVYLRESASIGRDENDAAMLYSLSSEVPHFYSVDGNKKMVANAVPFPAEDYSIPMGLKTGAAGTYTITAEDIQNFNSSVAPILEDTQTGAEIDLRFESSYTFDVAEPGINHSRFILHLKSTVGINSPGQKPQLSVAQTGNALRFYNLAPGEYQLRMVDVMGRVVLDEKLNAEKIIALPGNIQAGHYIIQLVGKQTYQNTKILIY